MLNLLIIPSQYSEEYDEIISLADELKKLFPDCSISVLVNSNTYDAYYQAESIDGLIVEPTTWVAKLNMFVASHYHAVFSLRIGVFWQFLFFKARIKKVFVFAKTSQFFDVKNIIEQLKKLT
jgi:ADP-heptose:LPS heptosyltransferase